MTREEARAVVLALVGDVAPDTAAGLAEAADDTRLGEDLGLDSTDVLEVVDRLAARTGVRVPERDFGELQTLGRFVAYVAAAPVAADTPA